MKILKYLLVILVLSASGITYAYASVVRLTLIDYSDLHKAEGNLYLSNELPAEAEHEMAALLVDAKKRITTHYGTPNATPVIVALGNQDDLKKYGLNGLPGVFLFTPWNSYVLLNYQVANVDVTAHELVHAEVVHRVGYIKRQLEIPTWFDEGAGMQVDYRPLYDYQSAIDQAEFLRVTSLDTPEKFWGPNADQNIQNYRAAKSAVYELFKESDENLYSVLERIHDNNAATMTNMVDNTNKALQRENR